MLGDPPPAGLGIKPEGLGVALVQLGHPLRGFREGEVAAGEMGVEAIEVHLPARCVIGTKQRGRAPAAR